MPSIFFVNWEKLSLRGRRSKGKGKGIRARDRARGRREEGCHFIISLERPNSLSTPATRARKKCVARAKFSLLIRPTEFFGCFRCVRRLALHDFIFCLVNYRY